MPIQSARDNHDGLQKLVTDMIACITTLERHVTERDILLKDTAAELAAVKSRVDCLVSQNVRAAKIMVSTHTFVDSYHIAQTSYC